MRYLIASLLCILPLAAQTNGEHWLATWGTAQQLYRAAPRPTSGTPAPPNPLRRFGIPAPLTGLKNQTVRMIAHASIGGSSVRIRLESALGTAAVRFGSAHIALRAADSSIVPGSDRALTFSGKPEATLYAGATLISDPVKLSLPTLAHVAVSLYVPGETAAPTSHTFALHTTYISKEGDQTGTPEIADATTRESWYWLAGIDVLAPANAGTLVTFGDSITDGDQSTPETDGMWPDVAAGILASKHVGVVNTGISGNRVLGDNGSGLARYFHDVLSQPGLRWISILEGINDITGGSTHITAEMLIAAYGQMIAAAHERGIKVIGCTLTPYGGSNVYTEYGESVRSAVNDWIRTGRAFDAVVDFDKVTRDPADPKRLRADADSPDMLHPANPGYKLMGEEFARVFTRTFARPVTTAASAASPATRH